MKEAIRPIFQKVVTPGDSMVTPEINRNYLKLRNCDSGDSGDTILQGVDIENT
ncbi:hypothetical protein JWJ90_17030 [Desulfobulbus rhabdoformis]|uniref:hypothetical protein n=1 Tax=Desulfobulbus rhabdoformis TaxID=34032 RepID=UPI0019657C42|nr:hypothetical protein [Desulfobulbus rhabdoformis]MBM9615975.1 hypothetical protein [Desulfobulbus rhabdoformis]